MTATPDDDLREALAPLRGTPAPTFDAVLHRPRARPRRPTRARVGLSGAAAALALAVIVAPRLAPKADYAIALPDYTGGLAALAPRERMPAVPQLFSRAQQGELDDLL